MLGPVRWSNRPPHRVMPIRQSEAVPELMQDIANRCEVYVTGETPKRRQKQRQLRAAILKVAALKQGCFGVKFCGK